MLACGQEAEDLPAIAVWAAWGVPVQPVRLTSSGGEGHADDTAPVVAGLPTGLPDGATLLVLADATFPADALVTELARVRPDITVVGGLTGPAASAGGGALLLDDAVHRGGAVGVVIRREHLVGPVVSQGCRPVGEPMVVTGSDGSVLVELAGRPALERLTELAADLPPDERRLLAGGIHLGIVIDEGRESFDRGDFLVRAVVGADKRHGVLAVGARVPVGTTVQFQVRDAESADADLRHALRGLHGEAALVFTCNGRGRRLFGVDDHDASIIGQHLGTEAVAGMFCAGEMGPVGGRSFVHGYTASVLIFADD